MSTQVQLRHGTTVEHSTFAGASGEVTVDTTKKTAVVHDGSTAGGFPLVGKATTDTLTNKTFDTAGSGNSLSVNGVALTANTGTGAMARASLPSFLKTIGVGGATASASGSGISFPATQDASTDANTLDDYEEGTFTPSFTCGTVGDLSVTYSVQIGNYTKIGREVKAQFSITTSAFTWTTSSGNVRLDTLPFNAATQTSNEQVGTLWGSGITKANYTSYNCRAGSASGSLNLCASGSAVARASMAIGDFPSGGTVTLSGVLNYHTA